MPQSKTGNSILTLVRTRIRRGLGINRLGPNEARLAYDFVLGFCAGIAAYAFDLAFLGGGLSRSRDVWILAAPFLLVAINAALGLYSRYRAASGERKAVLLTVSCLVTAALELALVGAPAIPVLWLLVTVAPITLSRLLLNLQFSRRSHLVSTALNRNGPVLVIGGAGYIGTHAVEQLLERGYRVRVLDRLMYGDDSIADFRRNPRFEFHEGDAADISRLTAAMQGASAVVHLAGLVGDPACAVSPEFTRHTNIVITKMVRLVAQSMGVSRFIFASSCSVYGSSDVPVDELSALNPVSLYAETKIDSERELLSNVPDDFFITILRFATVFGHSRRPRFDLVANLFAVQALTEGRITAMGPQQWRPFIHVRDLGRAIATAVAADPYIVQGQIFNVGDGRLNKTIMQLAEAVREQAAEYRDVTIDVAETPDDVRNYFVAFDKIRDMLGFEANVTLEEGLREMMLHQRQGDYADYRSDEYSNVATTRRALERFNDPEELGKLYAPLAR